jgi:hypothetical protein
MNDEAIRESTDRIVSALYSIVSAIGQVEQCLRIDPVNQARTISSELWDQPIPATTPRAVPAETTVPPSGKELAYYLSHHHIHGPLGFEAYSNQDLLDRLNEQHVWLLRYSSWLHNTRHPGPIMACEYADCRRMRELLGDLLHEGD